MRIGRRSGILLWVSKEPPTTATSVTGYWIHWPTTQRHRKLSLSLSLSLWRRESMCFTGMLYSLHVFSVYVCKDEEKCVVAVHKACHFDPTNTSHQSKLNRLLMTECWAVLKETCVSKTNGYSLAAVLASSSSSKARHRVLLTLKKKKKRPLVSVKAREN